MKFCFGDIVVVDGDQIGVVVKSWCSGEHEVYIRNYNVIETFHESEIERYMVRHKDLDKEELKYQYNAIHGY